jgi:Domain of unknown function (DUF222)
LANRLRISRGDARRRLDDAQDLGPRTAITGEPLAPVLPQVAAAQAAGAIGAEHAGTIRRFFADLPAAVDIDTRQGCEATLARIAAEHTPDALRKAAQRLMALVHPDRRPSQPPLLMSPIPVMWTGVATGASPSLSGTDGGAGDGADADAIRSHAREGPLGYGLSGGSRSKNRRKNSDLDPSTQ